MCGISGQVWPHMAQVWQNLAVSWQFCGGAWTNTGQVGQIIQISTTFAQNLPKTGQSRPRSTTFGQSWRKSTTSHPIRPKVGHCRPMWAQIGPKPGVRLGGSSLQNVDDGDWPWPGRSFFSRSLAHTVALKARLRRHWPWGRFWRPPSDGWGLDLQGRLRGAGKTEDRFRAQVWLGKLRGRPWTTLMTDILHGSIWRPPEQTQPEFYQIWHIHGQLLAKLDQIRWGPTQRG